MIMNIAIVLGTRPEIIKMAPIIYECERRSLDYFILHTGQHYTPNMDEQFFRELGLQAPRYNLGLGELSYRKQVGFFIKHITEVLEKERPDIVVVQGDTISVVAGALAANKMGIPVVHHEAGLRSHDITMLEEVNRTITDHISDILCTPTKIAKNNLIEEGFDQKKIFLTGNTIVDILHTFQDRVDAEGKAVLERHRLKEKGYMLVTAHRAENVDNEDRLRSIFDGLARLKAMYSDMEFIYPIHPRTRRRSEEFGVTFPKGIRMIDPVGYFTMLALQKHARLIITDSGGIQEEACVLNIPVVTIRDNTERPETIVQGCNVLVPGVRADDVLAEVEHMLSKKIDWMNPFGDGKAGVRIVDLIQKHIADSV